MERNVELERLEAVAQKIQDSVDMMANVFKHHEAFLTNWLEQFHEKICVSNT